MSQVPRPAVTLHGVPSQHPRLRVSIAESDLRAPPSCQLFLSAQLPPALFVDPYELPPHRLSKGKAVDKSTAIEVQDVTVVGSTELEKAVGWTDKTGSRRKIAGRRSIKSVATLPHSLALSSEYTVALVKLGPTGSSTGQEGTASQVHHVDFPIHARYLPPLPTQLGVAAGRSFPEWSELIDLLLHPSKGHYEEVQLPAPKLFYACTGAPTAEEGYKRGWEYIQPDALLDRDWKHLNLAPTIPLVEDANKFRLLAPIGSTTDARAPAFTVPLPQGDSSVTTLTQLATLAVICTTALWALLSVRSVLSRVDKSERALQKLAEGKTQ